METEKEIEELTKKELTTNLERRIIDNPEKSTPQTIYKWKRDKNLKLTDFLSERCVPESLLWDALGICLCQSS